MPSRWIVAAALLLTTLAAPLRAHDFWIEPSSFHPAPGDRVAVRLRVGEHFKGDPVPRDARRIERFAQVGAGVERPVPGVDGMEPAGYASFQAPGLYWIVYDSDHASVELDGAKFEKYLEQEGLDKVSRLRAKRGQSAAPGREIYSRCVKSLLKVGTGGPGAGWDRPLGLVLELIPEADPYSLKAGGELPVRLLFRSKPLAGALVVAFSREAPDEAVSARSDAQGRVRLRLARPGVWLVKAVHMVETVEPGVKARADWESFWASITFEMPRP
ncbi:MAG TPA: DUF4198 domain-containing protein [Thermoanaerobaculia bacterium]|nr:DUF4198 domain-containing protein [Thermoanaerobaculia bacterium]